MRTFTLSILLLLASCSSSPNRPAPASPDQPPDSSIPPEGGAGFTASPATHDFGATPVGGSAQVVVTIENGGTSSPGVLRTQQAPGFPIEGDTCGGAEVEPGGTCQITIGFHPDAARVWEATIEVRTDTELLIAIPVRGDAS